MNGGLNWLGRLLRKVLTPGGQARKRACQAWLKSPVLWGGILAAVLIGSGSAWASEPNRAGLVIQFADGQIQTLCITFEEEEISGADLLVRSDLEAVVDPSSGLGIIVCRIEGQGCDYPAEACFCQCSGSGSCAYWNYFYREPEQDGWTYAALGALRHKVRSGSVDAWVWGDGTTLPAADLTFEAICPSPTPTATQYAASTPLETVLPAATATSTPVPELPQTQVGGTPTPVATPLPTEGGPGLESQEGASSFWLFGGLVLILAAAGVAVWLRDRR